MAKLPWANDAFETRGRIELHAGFTTAGPAVIPMMRSLALSLERVMPNAAMQWDFNSDDLSSWTSGREVASFKAMIRKRFSARSAQPPTHIEAITKRGRGDLLRYPVELRLDGPHAHRAHWRLELDIELSDVERDRFRHVRDLIRVFFDAVVEVGKPVVAFGRLLPIRPRWPVESYSSHDFETPMNVAERAVDVDRVPAKSIGELTWTRLLRPDHLVRLGGRSAFLKDAALLTKQLGLRIPLATPLKRDHVLVELESDVFDLMAEDSLTVHPSYFTVHSIPALWVARRFSEAKLFAWQRWRWTPPKETEADSGEDPELDEAPLAAEKQQSSEGRDQLWKRLCEGHPDCFQNDPIRPTAAERRWARAEYGEFATSFVVSDERGTTALPLWVRFREESLDVIDPIFVGHPSRAGASFVFQSHRHGYDGKQGHNHWPRRRPPDLFHCPRCGHDRFRVLTVFQYSGDEDQSDDARCQRSPQDFFSWLAIRATCAKCRWTGRVVDIECA